MTLLSLLKVSLTKHGAHKLAQLLVTYGHNDALNHTYDPDLNIDINPAQARKTLAVTNGQVPDYWEEAIDLGVDVVNYTVAIAIIFSHHILIKVMQDSTTGKGEGTVYRDQFASEKAFTNFRDDLRELGLIRSYSKDEFSYSFLPIFKVDGIVSIIRPLLEAKLLKAKWDKENSFTEEAKKLDFHKVFGVDHEDFFAWLVEGEMVESKRGETHVFEFVAGHNKNKASEAKGAASRKSTKIKLLHNDLQTKLYDNLVSIYGKDCVGTEVATGTGDTSVDVVVDLGGKFTFYELKTSNDVRLVLREALGQIMEYAYWQTKAEINELIIVSPAQPTGASAIYIDTLREKFKIPIHYKTIDVNTGRLRD